MSFEGHIETLADIHVELWSTSGAAGIEAQILLLTDVHSCPSLPITPGLGNPTFLFSWFLLLFVGLSWPGTLIFLISAFHIAGKAGVHHHAQLLFETGLSNFLPG
jgi:hypothetical protein